MSRCNDVSRTNISLISNFKQASDEAEKAKRHSYGDKHITVRVVDIRRRYLNLVHTNELPELERLYRPYVIQGTLYMNFLTVCDYNLQFALVLLSPRFNRDMDQHKIKCGDIIKVKAYSCRVFTELNIFFEICGFELCNEEETYGKWGSWQFDHRTTEEIAEATANLQCPIQRAFPLHPWFESVPSWPSAERTFDDLPNAADSAEKLARFCYRAEIASIHENWRSVKDPFPYLACRIRARGNHELYKTDNPLIKLPMKINLSVYDSTGGCSLVIWDQAISEELSDQLREGTVILLRDYSVRRNMSTSKFKVDFGSLKRFPIELQVQDERIFGKKALEIVSPDFLSHQECSRHLPMIMQPCNTFKDIADRRSTRRDAGLQIEEMFPVAGIVVGLSRYYRIRKEAYEKRTAPIGRFFTSRWVELYDPRSELFLNVEVFINKQLDVHAALEVGDVAAFTYVRLCERKASNITEDLTYVTSTQYTELHVMKKAAPVDQPHPEIPTVIRKEMRRIKISGGDDQHALESSLWLGGAHQFVNTYYSNQAINKLFLNEMDFKDILLILKGLAFWEGKDVLFSGQIVQVELCTPEQTSCDRLIESNGKIDQTSVVLAKADFWDAMKETVPLYGSSCPHYLTLPMKFTENNRTLLHQALHFPKMNVHEKELQQEMVAIGEEKRNCEHFEVLSRVYYRIVILRDDKKVALSSFFLPVVAQQPPTFAQALHLSHRPLRKQLESPVNKNKEISELQIAECSRTASLVLNKDMSAVLQARCMGLDDFEMLFCQLYFKNSDDERLY